TLTSESGCDSIATLHLEVDDAIVPVFDAIGPLCLDATAPALPTTSTNGITGKWNPAAIITTTVGTASYTFTPEEGQCAVDTTIEVTIGTGVHTDTTATACGSFTWDRNGETYTESGEYLYTFVNGECEDSITLNLEITTGVHTDTTATACGSFTWDRNGETYTEDREWVGTSNRREGEHSKTMKRAFTKC